MKKNILLAFILMLVCVIGVTGLQLYFTFTSYKVESAAFERNTNEALKEAVDSAFAERHDEVLRKLKEWLNDTTFVTISCRWDALHKTTVFTIKQVVPTPGEQNDISMSMDHFTERLDSITPYGKQVFVNYMVNYVSEQLKEGSGWYYTYKLGNRINKAAWEHPLTTNEISVFYKKALLKRNINLPFTFNNGSINANVYKTQKINISLKKPQYGVWVNAYFADTNMYVWQQLKWTIIGSVVLVTITLGSFLYMVRLLLSQQRLSELKDDFISNMTHEIQSPLSSVMITAEALKGFDMNKPERDSYLEIILHQSKKLSALADEILAGAQLEKKGITLDDTIVLNDLLADLVLAYKEQVVIGFKIDEVIQFKVNAVHFTRALTNIIDNTVKYNEDENATVFISAAIKNQCIAIEIADNGPGIPDAYKEKIFDQFYRIPTGNVHNVKGYGLGLSYVKKVIEAHKGTVAVKNNHPKGSAFIIRLPHEA